MKIFVISLISLLSTIGTHAQNISELATALPEMVGKSTEKLNEDHADLLSAFIQEDRQEFDLVTPWHVWHFINSEREDRYIVFSGKHIAFIPGNSSAAIRLFSGSGEQLGVWRFSTGWRIDIKDADFGHNTILGAPTVTINSTPFINGRGVAKQIFSFHEDALYFVRAENSNGQLLRNDYVRPNQTLGGDVSGRTKEQWISDLTSDSLVRRLASLTYIGGVHMNPDRPRNDVPSESVEDMKIAQEIRNDEAVTLEIEKYRQTESEWLKQAAELAASPEFRN